MTDRSEAMAQWEMELLARRTARWRQGRKVRHHVYAQSGAEPSDFDPGVGSFPDPADAERAVAAVNAELDREMHKREGG